jgi:hypothetical protein
MSMMSSGLVEGNDGWSRRSASSRKSSQLCPHLLGFGKITTEFRADDIDSYFVLTNMLIL